jgi:hypothetical protein
MRGPTPMKTEQANKGLYLAVDDDLHVVQTYVWYNVAKKCPSIFKMSMKFKNMCERFM